MSDILRSALNNMTNNWSIGSNIGSNNDYNNSNNECTHSDNQFVGQNIELKGIKLRVERVIAEGGFGFVFRVRDLQTSEIYALKRLIASNNESKKEIENEIEVLTKLQTHKHIMQFISWGVINHNIYLLLSEYCGCGSLKDISLPVVSHKQINSIAYQICLAIERMHSKGIIHRDLKIENILFDNKGIVKLCDFGSATENSYFPDHNWTPIQRSLLEDEMCRHTTPMYRPPEILDTYLHLPITVMMDIWAFGCLLFVLKYGRHPFEDSAKLRIINCNYSIPSGSHESDIIVKIIKSCIKIDPTERVKAEDIIKLLEENFVDLNSACVPPRQSTPTHPTPPVVTQTNQTQQIPGSAQPSFSLSGFTRYIKDTSSKVMQTVQNSIARQDLDLSYLTTRLIVMSYPAEGLESAYRNHIEDVKAFLDSRHTPYIVINVSGRSYSYNRFGPQIKVFEGGNTWKDSKRSANLFSIASLCHLIQKWMSSGEKKVTVIHCMDGKSNSALLSVALIVWIGLFADYKSALNFFAIKRTPVDLTPSQCRYLSYISKIGGGKQFNLLSSASDSIVIIKSIIMKGIPLFTKMRDGCRPFVEVFMNGDIRIASTSSDYEKLRPYTRGRDNIVIWKDLSIQCDSKADIHVMVSHARSTLGSKMLQSKMTAIRISSFQFNLLFEHKGVVGEHILKFDLNSLEGIEENDRYPRDFQLIVEFELQSGNTSQTSTKSKNFDEFQSIYDPLCIFSNEHELEECRELFGAHKETHIEKSPKPKRPPPPQDSNIEKEESIIKISKEIAEPVSSSDFFNALNWEENNESVIEENKSENFVANEINAGKKAALNDLLLNLSIDETNSNSRTQTTTLNSDVSNDLFETNGTQLDFLIETNVSNNCSSFNGEMASNINLLNDLDLFSPNIVQPIATFDSKSPPIFLNENISFISNATLKSPTHSKGPTLNSSVPTMHRNISTPNLAKLDPLAELGSFLSSTSTTPKLNSPSIPRVSSFTTFQTSNGSKADYNRNNFVETQPNVSNNKNTSNARVVGNEFEDLLGGFKPTLNDGGNKSIGQLRKDEMLKDGNIDPMRLRVLEWRENKTRNIRALLCSLNVIIWEGCNWTPIGMHQLVTANDVKKMYRKACLAVHPDKLVGTEHEELAKLVFMELNDAWTEFEKQFE